MTHLTQPHPALKVARDGARLTITLGNPQRRNAQTPSLWSALAELAARLDPKLRVVVINAEGPSFSAGLDRGLLTPGGMAGETSVLALAAQGEEVMAQAIQGFQQGFAAWAEADAIVIAAVQGHAIGAGFQLALAADLRVVSDDVQFAMRETSLGMVPDLAGTRTLVHLVGYAKALEICLTARFVGAQEAVTAGLASIAVPADQLAATTDDLVAAVLAAPDGAVRELKPLLRKAITATSPEQLSHERESQARLLAAMARGLSSSHGNHQPGAGVVESGTSSGP